MTGKYDRATFIERVYKFAGKSDEVMTRLHPDVSALMSAVAQELGRLQAQVDELRSREHRAATRGEAA